MADMVFSRSELLHRVRQPGFVLSHALRLLRETLTLFSPTEFDAIFRSIRPLTMCSHARLRSLYESVGHVVVNHIPGDIVECGVARGGSAAVMALALQRLRAGRRLWLFDTFAGLPEPTAADPDYKIARNYANLFKVPADHVRKSLSRLGIALDQIEFVPGLFEQTLANSSVSQIALLHVDGDWYESVKATLEAFYDRVSPGGVIQFDDYGHWLGAQKAVDEFMNNRRIKVQLEYIDFAGRRMNKPA